MRFEGLKGTMSGVALAAALAAAAVACNDSSMVTAPAAGTASAATKVGGTWSGTFQSYSKTCTGVTVSATFQQNGADVTGMVEAGCGIRGTFHGTVGGNVLSGRIEMPGCSGGAVLGTASGSALSFTIGDFTRPVVTGDEIVMYGGAASLSR